MSVHARPCFVDSRAKVAVHRAILAYHAITKRDAAMEQLDRESQEIREVYARYGLAMYGAQCVERGLAILLATAWGPGPRRLTKSDYDDLLEKLFSKTFGSLFHRLGEHVHIPEEFESLVEQAVDKRNCLAHRYFWDKAPDFMTEPGRTSMIEELQEAVDFFGHINQQLHNITQEWLSAHGITQEDLDRQMIRLIRGT